MFLINNCLDFNILLWIDNILCIQFIMLDIIVIYKFIVFYKKCKINLFGICICCQRRLLIFDFVEILYEK